MKQSNKNLENKVRGIPNLLRFSMKDFDERTVGFYRNLNMTFEFVLNFRFLII